MIHTKGKTFTIKRSKWLRGEGSMNSELLRESDGKMCCLGQLLEQCGISRKDLSNSSEPWDIPALPEIEAISHHFNRDPIYNMMSCNDSEDIIDDNRESRLSELAQQAGFSLKFVD